MFEQRVALEIVILQYLRFRLRCDSIEQGNNADVFGQNLFQRHFEDAPFENLNILRDRDGARLRQAHQIVEEPNSLTLILLHCNGLETFDTTTNTVFLFDAESLRAGIYEESDQAYEIY